MGDWNSIGKFIVVAGLFFVLVGGLIIFGGKFLPFGRLPGDIFYQKGNFSFCFPVVSSIVISILITLILNFFMRR